MPHNARCQPKLEEVRKRVKGGELRAERSRGNDGTGRGVRRGVGRRGRSCACGVLRLETLNFLIFFKKTHQPNPVEMTGFSNFDFFSEVGNASHRFEFEFLVAQCMQCSAYAHGGGVSFDCEGALDVRSSPLWVLAGRPLMTRADVGKGVQEAADGGDDSLVRTRLDGALGAEAAGVQQRAIGVGRGHDRKPTSCESLRAPANDGLERGAERSRMSLTYVYVACPARHVCILMGDAME